MPEAQQICPVASDRSLTRDFPDSASWPDHRDNYVTSEWGLVAALMAHPEPEMLPNINEALLDEPSTADPSWTILQAIVDNSDQLAEIIPKSMNERHAFALSKQILVQHFHKKISDLNGDASQDSVEPFQTALRVLEDRNLVDAIRNNPAPWQERVRDINWPVTNEKIAALKAALDVLSHATKSQMNRKIADLSAARITLEERIAALENVENILDPSANHKAKNPLSTRISRLLDQFEELKTPGGMNCGHSLIILKTFCAEAREIEEFYRQETARFKAERRQKHKPPDQPLCVRQEYLAQLKNPSQARKEIALLLNGHPLIRVDPLTETLHFVLTLQGKNSHCVLPPGRQVKLHDLIAVWGSKIQKFASIHDVLASLEIGQCSPNISAILVMQGKTDEADLSISGHQSKCIKTLAITKRGKEIIFADVIAGQMEPPIIQKLLEDEQQNNLGQLSAQYFLFRTDSNPDLKRLAY